MDTVVDTKTLVISFSGALSALYRGTISASDLDGALFYFGCTRLHVFEHGVGEPFGEMQGQRRNDPEAVDSAYQTLLAAITASEAAGRVAWRSLEDYSSWDQLNELLAANGLTQIDTSDCSERTMLGGSGLFSSHYNYRAVIEAVSAQGLPYRVIWNA